MADNLNHFDFEAAWRMYLENPASVGPLCIFAALKIAANAQRAAASILDVNADIKEANEKMRAAVRRALGQ